MTQETIKYVARALRTPEWFREWLSKHAPQEWAGRYTREAHPLSCFVRDMCYEYEGISPLVVRVGWREIYIRTNSLILEEATIPTPEWAQRFMEELSYRVRESNAPVPAWLAAEALQAACEEE